MKFEWKKHKAIGPLLVFLAVIAAFIIGYDFGRSPVVQAPSGLKDDETAEVSMMLDFGDGSVKIWRDISLAKLSDSTVWAVLQSIAQKEAFTLEFKKYDSLGVMVEKIGDKKNQGVERAWQYWVNNQYATVSASKYQVSGGDVIEWKYIKGQQ